MTAAAGPSRWPTSGLTSRPALGPVPVVARGVCHLCFATDIGFSVDLERAASLLPGSADRAQFRERRTPSHLTIEPAPLRVVERAAPIEVGAWRTLPHVELTLFDFGGAAIRYRIPLEGPLDRFAHLSELLYENRTLLVAAQRQIESLLERVRPAVSRPDHARLIEDYAIFQVEAFEAPIEPARLLGEHAALLASILRAERGPLSAQEIAEATSQTSSYRPDDLLVVDWNAAFAVDDDFEAITALLEFANVELVELRMVDGQLDGLVDRAYEVVAARSLRDTLGIGPSRHEIHRLARVQMDSAIVFEQVNNALKLLGDEYLARVHRLAARRLHTGDWDASIERKLQTVDQIYTKVTDRQANRRMELLEWIIILLILWEVVWAFVR